MAWARARCWTSSTSCWSPGADAGAARGRAGRGPAGGSGGAAPGVPDAATASARCPRPPSTPCGPPPATSPTCESAAVPDSGLGVAPDEVFGPLRSGLVRPASVAWRGRPEAATRAAQAAGDRIAELRGAVRVLEPPGPYSLGTSNAPLLITVANGLPFTVRVRVEITPSGPAGGPDRGAARAAARPAAGAGERGGHPVGAVHRAGRGAHARRRAAGPAQPAAGAVHRLRHHHAVADGERGRPARGAGGPPGAAPGPRRAGPPGGARPPPAGPARPPGRARPSSAPRGSSHRPRRPRTGRLRPRRTRCTRPPSPVPDPSPVGQVGRPVPRPASDHGPPPGSPAAPPPRRPAPAPGPPPPRVPSP